MRTIAIEADIPAKDIGKINIYDKFTFVEVPEDVAEKVLGAWHIFHAWHLALVPVLLI